jgi:hypothetical protein
MADSGWPLKTDATWPRATGYTTRTSEAGPPVPLHGNAGFMPGRGSSAGGSYSTVGDLLRFARALPKILGPSSYRELMRIPPDAPPNAKPGVAWGGGAPGVNASVQLEGPWEVIVLANLDPPTAEEVGRNLGRLVGFPAEH